MNHVPPKRSGTPELTAGKLVLEAPGFRFESSNVAIGESDDSEASTDYFRLCHADAWCVAAIDECKWAWGWASASCDTNESWSVDSESCDVNE